MYKTKLAKLLQDISTNPCFLEKTVYNVSGDIKPFLRKHGFVIKTCVLF